ncbi:MAG: metX [Fibrobacteria bacterium]|nr:metX [Fibrobacteria bacterium]
MSSDSKIPLLQVETQIAAIALPPEGFRLVSGASLKKLEIAYETYGVLNTLRTNAVFICSPLTTDAHAAGIHSLEDKKPGWWDDMIGPGKAIDTNRYFVIAQNMLGGCKGTTGPASIDPDTGKPYGSGFPKITVEDMVRAQRLLVEHLGIDVLEAVIGGSMGGMQALQWSISYPGKLRKCLCIAAAANLTAQALGFEVIGRNMIVRDPNFHGGDYYDTETKPENGLGYARMIGHLTYLSAISMHEKFGRNKREGFDPNHFETGFEVENYLKHQGKQFVMRFDANSYLHITYAMDQFDLESRYGSLENAFREAQAEFLLVALSSDWLFPPEQTRELGKTLLGLKKVASVAELHSPHGHDAFLLEVEHLSRVIHGFLEKPAATSVRPATPKRVRPGGNGGASVEFQAVADLIEPGSHILDIGCGDGAFIDALFQTRNVTGIGIDRDLRHVVECLRKNVPVVQADVDRGLKFFDDDAFDYAVLNRTLQEMKKPRIVLKEILRVAPKAIVAFPNFGHIANRLSLLRHGAMPVSRALPHYWYDTPNIHLFSLNDFRELCEEEGYRIEKLLTVTKSAGSKLLLGLGLKNLGAEWVVARIGRG